MSNKSEPWESAVLARNASICIKKSMPWQEFPVGTTLMESRTSVSAATRNLSLGHVAREVCRFKYPSIDSRVASEVVVLDHVYLFATAAAEFSSGIAGVIPGGFS